MRIQRLLRQGFTHLPNPVQVALKGAVDDARLRGRHYAGLRQLKQEAERLSRDCLADIHSLADWHQRRPSVRHRLLTMLGLDPPHDRTPLDAFCTGSLARPRYRIEKWLFQSRPGLYVTANFYLPHDRPWPLPCVLYLNGHWPSLDGAKTGFQDRYLWYPANGYALMVVDPLGYGEIPGVHHGLCDLNWWHWLSLGYTPAGVEVWNGMRALDWLETRPEVDASRIGVTGISGGGVMTQFLAALDDRVAVAAPSCSTYTIGTQVALNLVPQQCDCTFYPNVFGMDFPEILALIAPRPLLILGGRKDPIFPPAGFRAAYEKVGRIYGLSETQGQSGPRCRLVESGEGHTDPPHFLRETHAWMCRWLEVAAPVSAGPPSSELEPEQPAQLRCTQVTPEGAVNAGIHDRWIRPTGLVMPPSQDSWSQRRAFLLNKLRSQTFAWFPHAPIPFKTRRRVVSGGYAGELAMYQEFEFDTEPAVPVKIGLLTPRVADNQRLGRLPLIIAIKRPGDHVTFPDIDEYLPLLRTHAIALLTPRFADRPLSGADYARIERTAATIGRSVAALHVWDVLRTLAWVRDDRHISTTTTAVYGRGGSGIVGLYAAILEAAIEHVVLRDPPVSHLDRPALPMILRDTDLAEVAALLAPRRLTFLGLRSHPWEATAALYGLTGAAHAITRSDSLMTALLEDIAPGQEATTPNLDEYSQC